MYLIIYDNKNQNILSTGSTIMQAKNNGFTNISEFFNWQTNRPFFIRFNPYYYQLYNIFFIIVLKRFYTAL